MFKLLASALSLSTKLLRLDYTLSRTAHMVSYSISAVLRRVYILPECQSPSWHEHTLPLG